MNGGGGDGAFNTPAACDFVGLSAFNRAASGLCKSFRYVTICHRCCAGMLAQDGIPFVTSPRVMYQKIAPAFADCVAPLASEGIFPVPCAF